MAVERASRDGRPGFLLHTYPYRETSLVAEIYTRDAGRVAVIARGARRPRSALRGVLMAFQPLLLGWSGKAELKTLYKAEWQGGYAPLRGLSVICGFYLNELLLKLLPREDPDVGEFMARALQSEGVDVRLGHRATQVRDQSLLADTSEGAVEIGFDRVLV